LRILGGAALEGFAVQLAEEVDGDPSPSAAFTVLPFLSS
jgi:hypothetical protein